MSSELHSNINIIIYRDACVSQKDKNLSCERVSNSSSHSSSRSSSKIVNVVLYDYNKFSTTFVDVIKSLGDDSKFKSFFASTSLHCSKDLTLTVLIFYFAFNEK